MFNHSFFKSFVYAFNGIHSAVKQERNIRIHLVVATFVMWFSQYYNFTKSQYAVIILSVAGVISLEMVNSAIERCVYKPSAEKYMMAGVVKDMAAGAVLVYSIGVAICGIIMFWDPDVLTEIFNRYAQQPLRIVLLLVTMSLGYIFITKKRGETT